MTDQPQTPENDGPVEPQPGDGTPDASQPGYGTPDPNQPSYGNQPAYGAPQPGVPGFPVATKTNALAIGSLVASVIGLLCGIGAIIGIVLGFIALKQINERGEGGKNLAIAGIAVGAGAIVLSGLFFLMRS